VKTGKEKIVLMLLLSLLSLRAYNQNDTTGMSRLFQMSLSELMTQEIVTSGKFSQRSIEAASTVTVITAEAIRDFNYQTLGEALNSQRGFYLTNDKNYLYVGSAGFSRPTDYNNRIVVMLDGHIMNEIVYGSAFMGNDLGINLRDIERIEIVRGPGASVYGSGAMFNTINLISKKGSVINGLQIEAATGSFGTNKASVIYGKKIKGFDFNLSTSAGISKGENYFFSELNSPAYINGISKDLDGEKFGNLQLRMAKGSFYLSGLLSSRFKNIPTGAFETDFSKDDNTLDNRYFIETGYKKDFSGSASLNIRAYYDDYYYKGSYPEAGVASYDRSKGSWLGTEVQYLLKRKNNVFTTGLEYKHIFRADYTEWTNTETYFNKNFPFTAGSLYAQDQVTLFRKLIVTAGLRYDAYSKWDGALSPRFSAVYTYSDASSFKLIFSDAFRSPNIYETYYESYEDHESNGLIKPERIKAFELGWGHKYSNDFYSSFSVYYNSVSNLINLTIDTATNLTRFVNIGKANGYGIETELRYQPEKGTGGFINMTMQHSVDASTSTGLTNSPGFLLKSGLVVPVTKRIFLIPEFYYETGRVTLKGSETADVYLFNVSLRISSLLKHFDLAFKARNVFNFKYFYPGGFEHVQDVLVQDSRNLSLILTARF
jgi:outer membrane receptor for ferrienterochelin and colicins